MDETSDEEEGPSGQSVKAVSLAGASSALEASAAGLEPTAEILVDEARDMSVSTLHLYDIHLSQVSYNFS